MFQKFTEQSTKEERRAEKMALLQDVLGSGKAKKAQAKQQKDEKGAEKMRKVLLGWLHFDEEKQAFVSVRTNKGGGTRDVDIKLNAGKEHIIDIAKAIFRGEVGWTGGGRWGWQS